MHMGWIRAMFELKHMMKGVGYHMMKIGYSHAIIRLMHMCWIWASVARHG